MEFLHSILKGVNLLHFRGKALKTRVAHGRRKLHAGDLALWGAVLLWLPVAAVTLCLHRGRRENGGRFCFR